MSEIRRAMISYIMGKTLAKEEVEMIISEMMNDDLKGKMIKDGKGKSYKVKICDCKYVSVSGELKDHFYSVDVYLENYSAEKYFLYSDSTFEKNLNSMLKYFFASYSESGMQGDDFVNLDVELKISA